VAVAIDRPANADNLYIERGDPVPPWRPIMAGDVFAGPAIPGVLDHQFIMVISHPCAMRRGAEMRPRLQALPVIRHQEVPFEDWVDKWFRILPLPTLNEAYPGQHYAARLDETGMVPTDELSLDNRLACLSETGVALALQRFFHCCSRVQVKLSTISAAALAPLEEASLQEEWNEVVASARVQRGDDRADVLQEETRVFQDVLDRPGPLPDTKLRDGLHSAIEAVTVRRIVAEAMAERARELGGG
jgi:hypothetical protein